ncbi:MAG: hypothetical protein IJM62_07540 [Lachnospiraceae bacterium]|nr:hypothetical protein [Lachnospiraceae bacterium]
MKSINLHIVDRDEIYLTKLETYLRTRADSVFSVKTCTAVPADMKKKRGIFLVTEEIYSENEERFDRARTLLLYDDSVSPRHEDMDRVYKYQPGDRIYRKLAAFCLEVPGLQPGDIYRDPGSMEILGLYSPDGKTDSFGYINVLKERFKSSGGILCVDLEDFPEGAEGSGSLQEILYFSEDSGKKLKLKLPELVEKRDGFDLLNTGARPLDIRDLPPETWENFFGLLNDHTEYGAAVIHFGMLPSDLSLMRFCDELYVVSGNNEASRRKAARFRKMLNDTDEKEIADSIKEIVLR